jgi:hypothetical protein
MIVFVVVGAGSLGDGWNKLLSLGGVSQELTIFSGGTKMSGAPINGDHHEYDEFWHVKPNPHRTDDRHH